MINKTEWNRMMEGKLYNPYKVGDNSFENVHAAQKKFNESEYWNDKSAFEELKKCFKVAPVDMVLTPPVYFDHGDRISFGKHFYANTDLTILDENYVTFGDNVFLAPHVSIYTAGHELILFETADKEIKLTVPIKNNTVWLNRKQLAELFGRDVKTIGKHINNALKEELDNSVVANFATTASDGKVYQVEHYNLDMIISIGYRVKSNRGVEFRKWANSVLKQYIIQGYAINEKRLEALQRTINIQTKMLACTLEVDEAEVLKAVSLYTNALMLLDQYDHQSLKKPTGSKAIYRITYEDCRNMVNAMEDSFHSDVFGIEKEKGKVEGILAAVYQNVFGGDVYPSLEEKAANLLYFMIKDHPYADGCKRIAASLFLEFLARNNILYKADQKRVSDGALVAITLMIAESDPKEKDIMVNLVMNLLIM